MVQLDSRISECGFRRSFDALYKITVALSFMAMTPLLAILYNYMLCTIALACVNTKTNDKYDWEMNNSVPVEICLAFPATAPIREASGIMPFIIPEGRHGRASGCYAVMCNI